MKVGLIGVHRLASVATAGQRPPLHHEYAQEQRQSEAWQGYAPYKRLLQATGNLWLNQPGQSRRQVDKLAKCQGQLSSALSTWAIQQGEVVAADQGTEGRGGGAGIRQGSRSAWRQTALQDAKGSRLQHAEAAQDAERARQQSCCVLQHYGAGRT